MFRVCCLIVLCILAGIVWPGSSESGARGPAPASIHHAIKITLHPDRHSFEATDAITVPESFGNSFTFALHEGLDPVSSTPHVSIVRESGSQDSVPLATYRVMLPQGVKTWVIQYRGTMHHPLEPDEKVTVRGSRGTPGQISGKGVFLSAESYWYPQFREGLLSFDVEITVPHDWDAVSQGERTLHELSQHVRRVRWHCPNPQEDISLVAGPFFTFSSATDQVQTMVYLHQPDAALAEKYLEATARYLVMYDKLIGLYPYKKFALVENFWETGYGMPSFALMGPKVIRFPFIITSSYPHEILHNWWGNSVYPDLKTGNWCEGLTAYLADHLLREQKGTATEYRRDLLQRFADYVSKENDFPLSQFRSRHSAATQAIGYGKALMFFHMLRLDLGDDAFRDGFRDFYHTNTFRIASYEDIRKSLETVSKKDLSAPFSQWVDRTGAPQIKVSNPCVHRSGKQYDATVVLEQTQAGKPYRLHVPVAVTMKDRKEAYETRVFMTEKRQEFRFTVPDYPVRIDVDPQYDVFRRLDQAELPAALTQVFGASRLTVVLPEHAEAGLSEAFSELARDWLASGPEHVLSVRDDRMKVLPSDSAVVILGWKNRFAEEMHQRLSEHGVKVSTDSVAVAGRSFRRQGLSAVFTVRNQHNPSMAVAWIATDVKEAVAGLARKIPHYHGYSYLLFTGGEPSNVLKGQWPVFESPMTVFVPQADGAVVRVARGQLAPRKPLAVLPPELPHISIERGF